MSFFGLVTRRALKAVVFALIDKYESDPDKAKQKREAASEVIMKVGLTLSLVSLDLAGIMDALHDHGINIAQSTIEHAVEHGSDVADHVSSTSDIHFGSGAGDYVHGYTYSPSTGLYYDSNYNYVHDGPGYTYEDLEGMGKV